MIVRESSDCCLIDGSLRESEERVYESRCGSADGCGWCVVAAYATGVSMLRIEAVREV